jgi:hypothetical protein
MGKARNRSDPVTIQRDEVQAMDSDAAALGPSGPSDKVSLYPIKLIVTWSRGPCNISAPTEKS